jgi:endo-1,4-beta-xylanase
VFHDDKGNLVDRETLLRRMRDHIHTVVGRYRGRVQSWDVVNEVLNEDGTLRQSLWLRIIGEDYIAKAFQFAHEADPQAELVYNDYSLEHEAKRRGAVALVKRLKEEGVPITGVGLQGHVSLSRPSVEEEAATIDAFGKLGMKVAISELDVDVLPRATSDEGADVSLRAQQNAVLDPYNAGLPDALQQQLAARYADLFRVYLQRRDVVNRITLWGVTDKDSWLNNWPVRGRTNYPLLFDRHGKPKPAFYSIEDVASAER